MEKQEYKKMYELEENHWWFRAKRKLLLQTSKKYLKRKSHVLDVGCGTGIIMQEFSKRASVTGFDISQEALKFCRKRGLNDVHLVDIQQPLKHKKQYDLIITSDIIEHLEKEKESLVNLKKLLKPKGRLVITVPAYQWLWSPHDKALHHKRRYTKKQLLVILKQEGFAIEKSTYTNMLILPPVIIIRTLKKLLGAQESSDEGISIPFINGLMSSIYAIERALIKYLPLPFGVGILVVANKEK